MRGFNKRSEKQAQQASRTSRWLLGLGALAMVVIGLGLLVLMTQATGNREKYNQNYEWLALTNAIVASGLLATILWGAIGSNAANLGHVCWSSWRAFLRWWV
jgi:hypothetical protein